MYKNRITDFFCSNTIQFFLFKGNHFCDHFIVFLFHKNNGKVLYYFLRI